MRKESILWLDSKKITKIDSLFRKKIGFLEDENLSGSRKSPKLNCGGWNKVTTALFYQLKKYDVPFYFWCYKPAKYGLICAVKMSENGWRHLAHKWSFTTTFPEPTNQLHSFGSKISFVQKNPAKSLDTDNKRWLLTISKWIGKI